MSRGSSAIKKIPSTDWLKKETERLVEGCKIEDDSGFLLHAPDGNGYYKGGMWTREYHYVVQYGGEFVSDANLKASIQLILDGQRKDGCIPLRVALDGTPAYKTGGGKKPISDHALDNAPFLTLTACEYVHRTGDYDFFRSIEPKLRRGLDHIRRADNGLVYNPPADPQVGYGWADTVRKTGHLLFTWLLYYQACVVLDEIQEGMGGDQVFDYSARADLIGKNISVLWDEQAGMYLAADKDCRQIDIWGSAYAAETGLTTDAQKDRIADYFIAHWEGIIRDGLVRHLPGQEGWQSFFEGKEKKNGLGEYQNGAYWSQPLPWVVPVVWRKDPGRARQMVNDAIEFFKADGVADCVNEDYSRKVPNYVTSATNLYAASRWLSSQR